MFRAADVFSLPVAGGAGHGTTASAFAGLKFSAIVAPDSLGLLLDRPRKTAQLMAQTVNLIHQGC